MVATHYHNDHYGAIGRSRTADSDLEFCGSRERSCSTKKGAEWYKVWFSLWPHNAAEAPQMDHQFEEYRAVTEKGRHNGGGTRETRFRSGGLDVTVVTSARQPSHETAHRRGQAESGLRIHGDQDFRPI